MLRDIVVLAWGRFKTIIAIVTDIESRLIATVFYFTILVPFGIGSRLLSDPLQMRNKEISWSSREPIPDDLEVAKRQG